jgi:hypothetical protein
MNLPLHRTPLATTVLTWVALGILAVSVLIAELALFDTARLTANRYPEFAHLQSPLVAAAIAFGVCIEAVLVITAVLVGSIRRGRIFDRAALKLVDALVLTLIVATALVAVVMPTVPGPPALVLALLGGVQIGTAFVLVVLVLRSLLRQAALMRLELNEVV